MKINKIILKLSTIIFLIFFLPIFSIADTSNSITKPKIKIGISTALVGGASSYGLDVRDSILFALDKLTDDRYEVVLEDDACSGKDAVTVAQKLINVDKVKYVLGFACSSTVLSSAPLYEKAKIPALVVSASSSKIANAGDYIFRTTPSDALLAKTLFNYIKTKHKSFGIISQESDYPQDLQSDFLTYNKQDSSPLHILTVNYLPQTTDFRTMLLGIKNKKVEGLFINGQSEIETVAILKQVRELQWDVPVYGAYFPGTKAFIDTAGSLTNGIEYVDTPDIHGILNAEGKTLLDEYVKKYGPLRSLETIFISSFEAVRAMDLAERSGKDVREYLYNTKFNGICGPYSFDKNGELIGMGFTVKRVENLKPVVIK